MKVKVSSTAEGYRTWFTHVEVGDDTTVAELRAILALPPYSLDVAPNTKVLSRTTVNMLVSLSDAEKVKSNVTLLNVLPDMRVLTFPKGFVWGSATASYQVEGAASEGGRSPSIWDTFAALPDKIRNGDTGQVACNHYGKFREDVSLMKKLGLHSYRFSISWSRLLPGGRGEPNPEAIKFYRSLLTELKEKSIAPLVTLYHWDLPQCLEDEYNGWLGRQVVGDFENYARACFTAFGDLVRAWITLNEPWCAAVLGYATGEHAPGRKSSQDREPYVAAHHMILAHARAVRLYRSDFQASQKGLIGISLNMDWKEPYTDSDADYAAQRRAIDWQLGWFADPIYKGDYPETMRHRCGSRLPDFEPEEQEYLKGSADFFGLNHYSTDYVSARDPAESRVRMRAGYFSDQDVNNAVDPAWHKTDIGWDIVAWGLRRILAWIQLEYQPPGGITITENGCAMHTDKDDGAREDTARVEYLEKYIAQVHRAIVGGVDVRGYYVWSFMDNFEWQFGYSQRFGIVHVDYLTQARTQKASAQFMSKLAKDNVLRIPEKDLVESEFHRTNAQRYRALDPQGSEAMPTLSPQDAARLLSELATEYNRPDFQNAMVLAYKRYLMDGNEAHFSKTRKDHLVSIQEEVSPKYGFEAGPLDDAKFIAAFQTPKLLQDGEVVRLLMLIKYLLADFPQERAAEQIEEVRILSIDHAKSG